MAQIVRSMGVDVSKAELVAVLWPERERRVVANTAEGWQALSAWARAMSVHRIGLEASGGYERGAAQAWADDGHWVSYRRAFELTQVWGFPAELVCDSREGRFGEGSREVPDAGCAGDPGRTAAE